MAHLCTRNVTDTRPFYSEASNRGRTLAEYAGCALRPGGIKLSEPAQVAALDMLSSAYDGRLFVCPHDEISPDDKAAFAEDVGSSRGADTYGELDLIGFLDMLWRVGAKPGARFYDLGAGSGKLVAMAWLAGLHATGIELSEGRWAASQSALTELVDLVSKAALPLGGADGLPAMCESGISFLHSSFFKVDFTDADLVFVASTMFTKSMVAKIAELARWMKPGAVIVAYHGLHDLGRFGQFPELVEIGEIIERTSWCLDTCWRVHEVLHAPAESEQRPQHLRQPGDQAAKPHQ
mmetsp:Transcript_107714/g.214043  ORF Transcript_107714/g.214043 Transcript_107714/m.214043 type:complete len:293 (-) Transcript_107714:228-1106(-)|eukprot:CAMPEP_0172902878 /NCGR_PEP_ID=MMETSP1075-20121228/169312_1 /TAXON_ID=2916 /ORGANISM="Ceratium fusus, Strain PA161109" /LENGTH=292 /DNA_ID=CAMNT_0013759567 /DNA_START=37 /DNA_END=915 /DNA_ORIENTATION=+